MTDPSPEFDLQSPGGGGRGWQAPSSLEPDENPAGLRMTDILTLPDPLRETVTWMVRKREVGLGDLAARLGQDETSARAVLANLVERGYLWETRVGGETRYRVRMAPQRKRPSSILDL